MRASVGLDGMPRNSVARLSFSFVVGFQGQFLANACCGRAEFVSAPPAAIAFTSREAAIAYLTAGCAFLLPNIQIVPLAIGDNGFVRLMYELPTHR